ncbi:NAD-dependent epimerase/dehydratase family protein [Hymenobacter sp. NBH84]|uniref:NAD-dependent epimerase/dehydratase family protein n=1 Tax=Hymenobacter sp. NBH84 TaxID=2596915 RepID=UPI00162472F3|nr:NAD-dependent epimerase/dehydratase family protein [Hymenobacter sp. NBH84]QNE39473.1 NAD-dependent epimerase/dehydratase family protein [Hymenobacter sp. NBH84]
MKTALVIGATGLVGDYLLRQLLSDDQYDKIHVFTRRPTGYSNPDKLEEHLIDFDRPAEWHDLLRGDVLFSSLGTTLKQAGSQEAQYKVDYTYQYEAAAAAARNGVPAYVLISSAGADPDAFVFYSRMKGELERDVEKLPFQRIRILQPGILAGPRDEARLGEKVGVVLSLLFSKLPGLHQYRPYHGRTVAQAMRAAAQDTTPGIRISTLGQVFEEMGE